MGRAPCCEKMGLKKGPWTPEEDRVLISHIQQHGHANWRALPKQAGLLRCGKSCRLRWINYLRPDIKRGNFTKEEEETIIHLHEILGNRWSAIAARLPGRTDNEIKNVWHTHLKKRLKHNQQAKFDNKQHPKTMIKSDPDITTQVESANLNGSSHHGSIPMSPQPSSSDNSSVTVSSITIGETGHQYMDVKGEQIDSWESFPEIDESFWSDALSVEENSFRPSEFGAVSNELRLQSSVASIGMVEPGNDYTPSVLDDSMDFWYNVFLATGDESTLSPLF